MVVVASDESCAAVVKGSERDDAAAVVVADIGFVGIAFADGQNAAYAADAVVIFVNVLLPEDVDRSVRLSYCR